MALVLHLFRYQTFPLYTFSVFPDYCSDHVHQFQVNKVNLEGTLMTEANIKAIILIAGETFHY